MYQEMEYILDILYDNDRFEHILSGVRSRERERLLGLLKETGRDGRVSE